MAKKFEVKSWNAVTYWSWNVYNDECPMCKTPIGDKCIECQAEGVARGILNECVSAWGECNHAYHLHCIDRWLKGGSDRGCPLDRKAWVVLRLV